jgi:tRNA threonylcarbamoyladenosine biosynthesis protein TsaE
VFSITTSSAGETIDFGELLGSLLLPGDFIALKGDLGSGKTQLTRGVALGVGVSASVPVTSPTYTIMNEYHGRIPLYHFDFYRLAGVDDILELGFEEFFHGREGACVAEWAERLGSEIPEERLDLVFTRENDTIRTIVGHPHGARYLQLCNALFSRNR